MDAADTRVYKDWDGGRTPLHYAAHYGKLSHFKTLVELGADLRCMSKVRWALRWTCYAQPPSVTTPPFTTNVRVMCQVGWPALFYAVENSKKKPGRKEDSNWHLELVEWIVEQDLADNVWCTASNGRTPLMLAAIQVRLKSLLTRAWPGVPSSL